MKKIYLRTMVAVLLLLCSTVASAHRFEVGGIYYNIISSSDLTVEVTYKGNDYYSYDDEYSGAVVIPQTVTYNSKTYSVTTIGRFAFYNCTGLTSIEIPNSVTSIGDWAFSDCTGLTSITIPNSVTSIGERAFHYTAWYNNQPEGLVYAGKVLYKYKGTMPQNTSIVIKDGTLGIADDAFYNCRGLTSVTIPNSVTTIGYEAFSGCTGLTSVTIPNSVTTIGDWAFHNCTGLTSIEIPNNVTSIEAGAFYGCTGLTSVTIPNNVTTIGYDAFRNCSSLTSVTIPNSVTTIGSNAFVECTGLTSVTIPNSVTTIGSDAFFGCIGLTSVTIPNSVTTIGGNAFVECTGLTSISVEKGNAVYDSRENCNAIIETQTNTLIAGCKNTIIPSSVTTIEYGAFQCCNGLTSVTIPNSVTTIGRFAFYNCTGLTSIEIPNSVTSIGDYAFSSTAWYNNQPDGLVYAGKVLYSYKGTMPQNTSIVIKDGTLGIAGEAFWYCTGLTSVTIPNSVTAIGDRAFDGCSGLTSISVEKGNAVYDSRENCNAIIETQTNTLIAGCKNTIIPNSVTTIGNEAFRRCTGLTSIEIPGSVITIGNYAFNGCTGLTSVTIPNSVTNIGDYAFSNCADLTDVYCHATTVPETSSNAFNNSNATNATLHVPATAIESYRTTAPWSNFGTIVAIEGSEENKNLLDLGACGDNLTCAIDTVENKLYINGTGDMYDFDYNNHAPWYNYRIEITSVSINDGVTTIGAYAFHICIGVTSITIPNSVTNIGRSAFNWCNGLTSITIPNSVKTISNGAFSYCSNLKSVTIPNSVTTIEYGAFMGCKSLTSIEIPNSVTTIGGCAFNYCDGLSSIIVEEGNKYYDSREECNAIIETATNTLITGCKNTIIPGSVTIIGYDAFRDYDSLTSITIPNSVTNIYNLAFDGCSGLTSIIVEEGNAIYDSRENCNAIIETQTNTLIRGCINTIIPNSVTNIGDRAFSRCSDLTSITIPNSVTNIGRSAFWDCTGLTTITIPNSVTNIGGYAFSNCTGLTTITIPNSVTNIGDYAFSNCTGLTTITIPNSVTNIGDYAFGSCTGLTDVYCHATTVPETNSNAFNNSNATNATLHVPATAIESYRATAPWSNFGTIVAIEGSEENKNLLDLGACGDNLTCAIDTVENKLYINGTGDMYDFDYNNHAPWYNYRIEITSVSINDGVTTIGAHAFDYCIGLTSVTIPNSVTSIGDYAFYECTGLTSVTIPNSVTNIGDYAFSKCKGLTSITVEGGNAVYDSRENCNAIIETQTNTLIRGCKNTIIPNSVTTIGSDAFGGCTGLTSVTIPNSVTTIGGFAFYNCRGLTTITIPNSVTTIGDYAFCYCTGLISITIPNSVTTIGNDAFHNCDGLTSIIVEKGNAIYDSRENCNAIIETQTNTLIAGCKNTIIPGSVTNIGDHAFSYCIDLTSITIPNSVTNIGRGAFWYCTGLTSITIPNSVTNIGDYAFQCCYGLTSITIPNGVTNIGHYAFRDCTGLTDVYCLATTVPETNSNAFNNSNATNATLHVPATAIESYRATAPWSDFGTIVAIEGSEEDSDEPSITTGEAIDLGLPSGIKWASCNIGATAPEEYGGYYAWGETEEKDSYDWSTYKWCNGTKYSMTKYCTNSNYGTVDNKTTLDPEDDVAHVKWGGNWRMPTLTEQQELIDNCVWVWTTINDVIGYNVTGPNGNSIFLPAAGFRSQKATKAQGSAAHYWTGSLNDDNSSAFAFYFYNKGHRCISNYRDRGHTVRPVYDDGSSTSIEIITPEVNNENTIYDLRGQKLTEITAPGIYIVNGKKVIVK